MKFRKFCINGFIFKQKAARRGPRPKVEPKTEAQNGDTGHEIISIFGHFPSQKERSSPKAKWVNLNV